jgi:hypothetical protein
MPWKAVIDWRLPHWMAFGRVVMVEERDQLDAAIAAEVGDPSAVVTVHLVTEVGPTAYRMHVERKQRTAAYRDAARTASAGRHIGI